MAYQLQPGLAIVENPTVPEVNATDEIFVYPQPTSLKFGARPNTMLYGTAPFMAGKGAPAEFVETSDALRPQSTTRFGKVLANTYESGYFPINNAAVQLPPQAQSYQPSSTRAQLQNGLFDQRYTNKNISKK
jgi:hypothetical protein